MSCYWNSKIIVFRGEHGQNYVSTSLPMGTVFGGAQISVYQARGPYTPPIGFPKPELVDDATVWMALLMKKGFTFEASTLD